MYQYCRQNKPAPATRHKPECYKGSTHFVHNTCAIKFVHTEMHLQNFLLTKESHGHVTLYRFQDKKRSLHLQNTQINNILS